MAALQLFVEDVFIPVQLILGMFGMGATLTVRDFLAIARDPRGLAIGLGLQWIVVPALAFAFTHFFHMRPGWAVGLLLVAVVPGGAFSNLLTFLGRGNTPLSISVTLAATAACFVTVPVLLGFLASSYLPDDFALPAAHIGKEIGLYLLLPLAAGMLLLRRSPERAAPISRWAIRASVFIVILIWLSSMASGRMDVMGVGPRPPFLITLFVGSLAFIIPHLCRLLGRYDDDTVALGIEVLVRNVSVALLLVHFFFPNSKAQGQVLYTCFYFGAVSGLFMLPMLLAHRFARSPVFGRRPLRRPTVAAD